MKILIAPNAFKGSLSAYEVCCAVEEGIRKVLADAEIVKLPMADGGDGTLDALVAADGGEVFDKTATGPLGEPVRARYAILGDGKTAVIEMASVSGLALLPVDKRDPMTATTYGTGELIKEALDKNCARLIIGIGGSATNDGGAGMAQALGARLLDENGKDIQRGGGALAKLRSIDTGGIDGRLSGVDIVIASDVTNPLCGPEGASYVYGPQKGATEEMVKRLDENLSNYSEVIKRDLGKDVKDMPGSGAAGGLGAGLLAFTNARLVPGAKVVMETAGFGEKVEGSDIVITGEGRLDRQTAYGKAPGEIARYCRSRNIPVIGICGMLEDDAAQLYELGFCSFFPLLKKPCTLEYAMENAYNLISDTAVRLMKILMLCENKTGLSRKRN